VEHNQLEVRSLGVIWPFRSS